MNALKESIFNDLNERANKLFEAVDNTSSRHFRERANLGRALDIARKDGLGSRDTEHDLRFVLARYIRKFYSQYPEELGSLFEGVDPNWGEFQTFSESYPTIFGALGGFVDNLDADGVEALYNIAEDVLSKFKAELVDKIKRLDLV